MQKKVRPLGQYLFSFLFENKIEIFKILTNKTITYIITKKQLI